VVIEQRPGAGTEVDKGSQVVIVIGVLVQQDTLEEPVPPDSP
jgi:beta-lactam-binding protein with PASTA domain